MKREPVTSDNAGDCKCRTDGDAVLAYPYIVYCPIHGSARALFAALRVHVGLLVEVASLARDVGLLSGTLAHDCRRAETVARALLDGIGEAT